MILIPLYHISCICFLLYGLTVFLRFGSKLPNISLSILHNSITYVYVNSFPVFAEFLIVLEVKLSDKFWLKWSDVDLNWIIIFLLFQQASSRGGFEKLKNCIIAFRNVMFVLFCVYHGGRTFLDGFLNVLGLSDWLILFYAFFVQGMHAESILIKLIFGRVFAKAKGFGARFEFNAWWIALTRRGL